MQGVDPEYDAAVGTIKEVEGALGEYLEEQKGLGTSQKAEVAWLDRYGYEYEELDVRDFASRLAVAAAAVAAL